MVTAALGLLNHAPDTACCEYISTKIYLCGRRSVASD